MNTESLTPIQFDREMERIVHLTSREAVAQEGYALIERALGAGMPAYLPALDSFCKRLREFKWVKGEFGPPTAERIEQATRNAGMEGGAL